MLALVLSCVLAFGAEERERIWKDATGREIKATLVGASGDEVELRVNGKVFPMAVAKLSREDRDYISKWAMSLPAVEIHHLGLVRGRGGPMVFDAKGDPIPEAPGPAAVVGQGAADSDAAQRVLARKGRRLLVRPGQSIRTGADADADFLASFGGLMRMEPESEVRLPELGGLEAGTSLELLRGRLLLEVDKERLQSERRTFQLKTPNAQLGVRGTQFEVEASAAQTTVKVYRGAVVGEVAGNRGETVEAEMVAVYDANGERIRAMTPEELAAGKAKFATLAVRRSPLTDREWNWTAHQNWEVHRLLIKDKSKPARKEVSTVGVARGLVDGATMKVRFRGFGGEAEYGEFRIDTVIPETGPKLVGAELRLRVKGAPRLIVTPLGADAKELDRRKRDLLDKSGSDYLVGFHNLMTILEHKTRYWPQYQLADDRIDVSGEEWLTRVAYFSEEDYAGDLEVRSWYLFVAFEPDVLPGGKDIEIEIEPPVLVFEE